MTTLEGIEFKTHMVPSLTSTPTVHSHTRSCRRRRRLLNEYINKISFYSCFLSMRPKHLRPPPIHCSNPGIRPKTKRSVLKQNHDQTPSFKKCRPKELNKQLARAMQSLHHHSSVRRPAAVRLRRPLPWRPSFRRPEASTVSPSRFGRNTFARNY